MGMKFIRIYFKRSELINFQVLSQLGVLLKDEKDQNSIGMRCKISCPIDLLELNAEVKSDLINGGENFGFLQYREISIFTKNSSSRTEGRKLVSQRECKFFNEISNVGTHFSVLLLVKISKKSCFSNSNRALEFLFLIFISFSKMVPSKKWM